MDLLRVAYAGHDFFSSCLLELVQNPSTAVVLCMTEGPGGVPAENVTRMAQTCGADIVTGRPDDKMIDLFNDAQVDLLVCAAYMYKIPVSSLSLKWAVNIHPTLLPEGRGPNPLPYLVDRRPDLAGISIHQMTMELDRGPILLQEEVVLDQGDGHDELYLKLFARAPIVLRKLLVDIDKLYSAKWSGGEGSYWREAPDAERILVAGEATVAEVKSLHARFGMFGILLELSDGSRLAARKVTASRCAHLYPPGTALFDLRVGLVVAVTDGLVALGGTQPA
jgi:methionyl-tRNA formyltransferase